MRLFRSIENAERIPDQTSGLCLCLRSFESSTRLPENTTLHVVCQAYGKGQVLRAAGALLSRADGRAARPCYETHGATARAGGYVSRFSMKTLVAIAAGVISA